MCHLVQGSSDVDTNVKDFFLVQAPFVYEWGILSFILEPSVDLDELQ
jgi:hypothetical protein